MRRVCSAKELRVAERSGFCLACLADEVETAFCFERVVSDCSVGSSTEDVDGVFMTWVEHGPGSGQFLFDGAVVLQGKPIIAVPGKYRKGIHTETAPKNSVSKR